MIPSTLKKLLVPVETLKPYARNPRRGDLALIKSSLERHGQYRPIIVRSSSYEVLAGNHTYLAAQELGWKKIAAVFVNVGDEQAARIVLADNRTSDLAWYDRSELTSLLEALPELEGSGYSEADLAQLLAEVAAQGVPELEREREEGGAAPQPFVAWGTKTFFLTLEEDAALSGALDYWLAETQGETLGFISWLLGGQAGLEAAA